MTNEELVARIKAGIDSVDNMLTLWEQNNKFIHIIAKRYQGNAEIEDLEQEGYLALYDAIDGFDAEKGYKFLTYAEYRIRQRMTRYIQNNGTVRIPVHEGEKLREYKKLVNSYRLHLGRKPSRREIADNMKISQKTVLALEKAADMVRLRSMDSLLTADEDSVTVGDMVADEVDIEENVLEDVQREQLKAVLWPLVDVLPGNQGLVLRKRFQENRTLKETGESIGVTLERVRQIEHEAMRGLRRSRNAKLLRSFLDDERIYSMGLSRTGLECFNRTWTSSTERAALFLMDK